MDTPQAVLLTVGFILATLPIFLYQNYVTLKKRYEELEQLYAEEHELRMSLERQKTQTETTPSSSPKQPPSSTDVSYAFSGILKTLNENQRHIMELITAADGHRFKQLDLFHETGIPKSTLSYELKSLEQKNLVDVKNAGRTNIVEASQWIKDMLD